MKSEEQIREQVEAYKDLLVDSNGTDTLLLQGFIRALNWTLSDEKEEEEE